MEFRRVLFRSDKVLMLNEPEMIRHVLQDNRLNYEKSKFYDVMRAILGNGIFLAEGDEWLSQRRSAERSFQGCQLLRLTAARRTRIWSGPSVSVRLNLGGRRFHTQKTQKH